MKVGKLYKRAFFTNAGLGMAGGQTVVENGRVKLLTQLVINIAGPLMVAGILGLIILVLDMKDTQQEFNQNIELHIQASGYEHADINRRIREIEQQRTGPDNGGRDQ